MTLSTVFSAVVQGAEAANPRTKKYSAGLAATSNWLCDMGNSCNWFQVMVALIVALGFVFFNALGSA